jgi:molybdopterin/thiamine biosynthesis adenylyltransferase
MRGHTALIGCGFLGSLWTEEVLKRLFALEKDRNFLFVDNDVWEERNIANQLCTPDDVGKPKCMTVGDLAAEYDTGDCDSIQERVNIGNAREVIGDAGLIVDALDNIESRHVIWTYGQTLGIPVLHLGISQGKTGSVQWSYGDKYTSWTLSPAVLKSVVEGEDVKLPPCQLVGIRSLGRNVATAGAIAYTLALGHDIEMLFGQGDDLGYSVLTNWRCGLWSIDLDREDIHVKA